jgi:hypothetical protein
MVGPGRFVVEEGMLKTEGGTGLLHYTSRSSEIKFDPKYLRGNFVKFGPAPVDVYQTLLAIPAHNERHLQQIAEVKASPNYPKK